ncbi:hypothetical protein [Deinococcus rufus]|uniref:Uncharacterized protein n=1 Tax=Deinococcus rufus TaxID=2136097 RepID=A0ABV7Z9M4_9DEIO
MNETQTARHDDVLRAIAPGMIRVDRQLAQLCPGYAKTLRREIQGAYGRTHQLLGSMCVTTTDLPPTTPALLRRALENHQRAQALLELARRLPVTRSGVVARLVALDNASVALEALELAQRYVPEPPRPPSGAAGRAALAAFLGQDAALVHVRQLSGLRRDVTAHADLLFTADPDLTGYERRAHGLVRRAALGRTFADCLPVGAVGGIARDLAAMVHAEAVGLVVNLELYRDDPAALGVLAPEVRA